MLVRINLNSWQLISLVTMYIDWVIYFIILYLISKKNISNTKYFFSIIIIIIFITYLDIYNVFHNFKIILCIIIGSIFYKLSHEDKIYKCIIVNLLFWLGIILTEVIAIVIVLSMNDLGSIKVLFNSNFYIFQGIIISKMLLALELILFNYFRISLEFRSKDIVLVGIPVLSNIVSVLLIFEYSFNKKIGSITDIFILMFTILLIVLSSITLLILVEKIIQNDKIKLEYELIHQRIKTNQKNYEDTNEIKNKIRYIYHDLKNHMICMKNYKSREEIIDYIENLEFQINEFEKFTSTGNETLDIIINEKKYTCQKHDIEFIEYINISKLNFLKDVDICVIFANALDNAVEACINVGKDRNKKIEVKVTYINGFSIFKFTNTKNNEIKIIDGNIKTNKTDKSMHGIGIASVKYIVNKYDGQVIVDYSETEFILTIMIPIK